MNKKLIFGIVVALVLLILILSMFFFVRTALNNNVEEVVEYKDVRYFFDNIEAFDESLPKSGISESVTIRGRIIETEFLVVCKTAPCPPVKHFALQDINDKEYKIIIYQVNPLIQQLKIGKTYILKGKLEKDIDFGRKIVYISNFDVQEIIKVL